MAVHAQKQPHQKKRALFHEQDREPKHRSRQVGEADHRQIIGDVTDSSSDDILRLQQIVGNQTVTGLVQAQLQMRQSEEPAEITSVPPNNQAIQRTCGTNYGSLIDLKGTAERLLFSDYTSGKIDGRELKFHLINDFNFRPEDARYFVHQIHLRRRANLNASLILSGLKEPPPPVEPARIPNPVLLNLVSEYSMNL